LAAFKTRQAASNIEVPGQKKTRANGLSKWLATVAFGPQLQFRAADADAIENALLVAAFSMLAKLAVDLASWCLACAFPGPPF